LRIPAGTDDCWVDGRRVAVSEARLPIDDPALQAGLGLFETIALRDGRLLELVVRRPSRPGLHFPNVLPQQRRHR